jgi:hypothetical protein
MGFRWSATLVPSLRRTISVTALAVLALWLMIPGTASAGEARNIGILDRCDPASFNAAFGDGTCVMRNSGVPLDTFLARVNPKDGGHSAWRFTPEQVRLRGGQFLRLDNRGGEVHTFTEVVSFGGGFVEELNATLPRTPPVHRCGGANRPSGARCRHAPVRVPDPPLDANDRRTDVGLS